MIERLVRWCLANRSLVLIATLLIVVVGTWAMHRTPVDAIPDLSENQVIVLVDWPGRSAQEVEDQITFPLSSALQGLAAVREVRGQSAFGFSMLTVIFRDDVDVYFARTRVLERLNSLSFKLPDGVVTNTIWMTPLRRKQVVAWIWVNFVRFRIGLSGSS